MARPTLQVLMSLCSPLSPDLVVYNRIPKSGSSTMLKIIHSAAIANNFTVVSSSEYNVHIHQTIEDERRIVDQLVGLLERHPGRRVLFEMHFKYINLAQYLSARVASRIAYINLMRSPRKLIGSAYYWLGDMCGCNLLAVQPWCSQFLRDRARGRCNPGTNSTRSINAFVAEHLRTSSSMASSQLNTLTEPRIGPLFLCTDAPHPWHSVCNYNELFDLPPDATVGRHTLAQQTATSRVAIGARSQLDALRVSQARGWHLTHLICTCTCTCTCTYICQVSAHGEICCSRRA